jgi:hypothetical protein
MTNGHASSKRSAGSERIESSLLWRRHAPKLLNPKPVWRSGVASIKTFTAQLTAFGELAFRMGAQLRSYRKTVGNAPQFSLIFFFECSQLRDFLQSLE